MMLRRLPISFLLIKPIQCMIPLSFVNPQQRSRIHNAASRTSDCGNIHVTSLLFLVSYDGGRFTGWSASNDRANQTGFVRSVEGVLRKNLAKLFGNVDQSRIVIEGTSRTDKGVHASGMVVQAYCLSQDWNTSGTMSFIPGKRLPHPSNSSDDSCFVPFRKSPVSLVTVLNSMLPDDVSVLGVCPSPSHWDRPFHPTLDAQRKTYLYRFSVGPVADPSQWRRTWHIGEKFETMRLDVACVILEGTHDFRAFRGSPRSKSGTLKQQKESTICTLFNVSLEEDTAACPIPGLHTYQLCVTGDRFVYKMVRYLVGSLVALGQGSLSEDDLVRAIEGGSFHPQLKPRCAPGNGLVLADVTFEPDIKWLNLVNTTSN